jgi:membrane-associated phospholipid phosphatase
MVDSGFGFDSGFKFDINLLDYIGLSAYVILFLLTVFLLQNKIKYLQVFVIGFFLNIVLNAILKYTIRDPRPTRDSALDMSLKERNGFDKYGMPSGHAQNCAFCLAYITLVLNNPLITGIYLVITVISVYQRYKYSNHTALQLLIGLAIGIITGYLAYHIGNKWIKGNLKLRPDDYAPK